MTIQIEKMALNRKVAQDRSLESFFQLATEVGIHQVELRNDMTASDHPETVIDQMSAAAFNALKAKYGMKILTINALQQFNQPAKLVKNRQLLTGLAELAVQIDSPAIIFVPEVNPQDSRTSQQRLEDAAHNLQVFGEILATYHLTGLVEPLGFMASTLRYPWTAQQAIELSGRTEFKLTIDTFHFFLAHITAAQFKANVDVKRIGLVHLSGIEPIHELREVLDEDRLFITDRDIMQNVEQVQLFESMGYKGNYSFEAFSTRLAAESNQQLAHEITTSIAQLNQSTAVSGLEV
ncbi:TIM barrel protein [Lacticaseibacillus zeae]|uniref:TIM barrel protein n=2 Tax=Lacticaseibacillus zeae TaxID=57037 RepID=A0ABD7ZAH9_LACZE|nr:MULTISPECIES: TIM barrel protein [unclassified Lacticaseibacillus]OFR90573.1 xylose isomerase [Lactobacillus sp. HMSC068F07]WLV83938.1 TIM barrel protein [Lacticaseibacillus sp. NCIMB 15475]WLV86694.1 TIM barrel protein [Lacticaseibacillus sp. NCIMB 15474]